MLRRWVLAANALCERIARNAHGYPVDRFERAGGMRLSSVKQTKVIPVVLAPVKDASGAVGRFAILDRRCARRAPEYGRGEETAPLDRTKKLAFRSTGCAVRLTG